MTKWPVKELTHRTTQKHVQPHDATDIRKPYFCVFKPHHSKLLVPVIDQCPT